MDHQNDLQKVLSLSSLIDHFTKLVDDVAWPVVLILTGLILFLLIVSLVLWRYYSVRRLSRVLATTLVAQREQRELTEALVEAAAAVSSSLNLEQVLDHILEQVERVVAGDGFNIMLIKAGVIQVVRWREYAPLGTESLVENFAVAPVDVPNLRAMMESGQPLVIRDVKTYPQWRPVPGREQLRSHVAAPIRTGQQTVGFLNVDSVHPDQFDAEDARRLEAFASQAAIAIENARLYEQARQDAETKAILLHEVNHRVKNNLAAIIGLLYAELHHPRMEKQKACRTVLQDLINRTQGLATVHRLLSASQWAPLFLTELAAQLIDAAAQALPPDKTLTVDIPPAPIRVSPKQANHLALVINELATNTVKYAFIDRPDRPKAHVRVQVHLEDRWVVFQFRDDGLGFPEAVLRGEQQNVGLFLVRTIVKNDLRGQVSLSNDNGAVIIIRFPQET